MLAVSLCEHGVVKSHAQHEDDASMMLMAHSLQTLDMHKIRHCWHVEHLKLPHYLSIGSNPCSCLDRLCCVCHEWIMWAHIFSDYSLTRCSNQSCNHAVTRVSEQCIPSNKITLFIYKQWRAWFCFVEYAADNSDISKLRFPSVTAISSEILLVHARTWNVTVHIGVGIFCTFQTFASRLLLTLIVDQTLLK